MPIGNESDRDIIRPKHRMAVPGLGVFIAPKAVARLFQLHDYTRCPNFRKKACADGENSLSNSTSKCLLFAADVSPTPSEKI